MEKTVHASRAPVPGPQTGTTDTSLESSQKQSTWLVRVSVSNPYLVIVLCLFIVVQGYVCLFGSRPIPVDILPTYNTPAVQVLTLYPGMPTEFMDRTITNRIERWTGQAVGIERQESRTMIGVSVVRDYFSEGMDPNAAFAQVSSLAAADLYYLPPGTVPPMVMLYDPTAPLPTAYLAASSEVLNETQVYELAYFNVRNMLQGTPGVIAPAVFGGKLRRIYAELSPQHLHARNLSFMDVQASLAQGSPMIPPGRLAIGSDTSLPKHLHQKDVLLSLNTMPDTAAELNQIPVKVGRSGHGRSAAGESGHGESGHGRSAADSLGQQVDMKAVGGIADRAAIQTNMVRITREPAWQGQETVYIPIMRRPGSNTIQVVEGVKKSIPTFINRLPPQQDAQGKELEEPLKLDVVADQSVFVRNAVNNLMWEGALGAVLASLMVLLFIGSVRSTVVIALTIPLAALVAVTGLYFTGHTLNLMTLGGLALVMGRLVDDPIIDIENTFRHLDMGKSPMQAALDSAREIAMPVLVATFTTVAVFFPVIFLYGMGKYLFQPLTLSVAFAMFASWLLSRTLSPAFCAYFLKPHRPEEKRFWLFRVCDAGYVHLRTAYTWALVRAVRARWAVVPASLVLLVASFGLYPFLGQELFPATDANQIVINVRLPAGTRIEKTQERISGETEVVENGTKRKKKNGQGIEDVIMAHIPKEDRKLILFDMGVLYDWPAGYTANAGPMDATILVQLTDAHQRSKTSQEYANLLRKAFQEDPNFQDVDFSYNTGGMISAALNFGLPAPINVQVRGRDMFRQYKIAQELRELLKPQYDQDGKGSRVLVKGVRGAVDIRVQQAIDYPTVAIELDYQRMADMGITMQDAAVNVLAATNGSDVVKTDFWLDPKSGNHLYRGVTLPEALITWPNLMLTSIRGKEPDSKAQQLRNLVKRVDYNKKTPVEINHQDLARVIDIYVNVEDRDVGSVAADIEKLLTEWGGRAQSSGNVNSWPVPGKEMKGYAVQMRGEVSNMRESFHSLGFGFVLAVILIYLIMVAQFRSFLDPFIILFAVPLGLIGVLLILFVTGTTLNIQSFMGVIFMVGIAVTNSILLVEFANRLRAERGLSALEAAVESAKIRLRPILMTMLAVIVGLIPLALHAGEATAPLARAVIGGLTASTALTIFVVPCLYVIFKGRIAGTGTGQAQAGTSASS